MGSQNLKYDYEALLTRILEEYTKKLNVDIHNPKTKLVKNIIKDIITSSNVSQKSEVIELLAKEEFLLTLSEELFVELFIVLPSWFYNIVVNFLQEIENSSDEDCLKIDADSPLMSVIGITNFLRYASKSTFNISIDNNLTVSEIGLKTVCDCYYQFINLNETKQHHLKEILGKLFQHCKNLQRCILYFLEHSCLVSSKDEVKFLVVNCSNVLVKSLVLASDLNPKEVAPILKVLGVLLNNSSEYLKDGLDVVAFVEYLCSSTFKFITPLLSYNEHNKVVNKSNKTQILKICNYQLKILILTCDKLKNNLGNSWPILVKFLLYLIELMPLRRNMFKVNNGRVEYYLEADNEDDKAVTENITVGMEPLLMHLISDRDFTYNVFKQHENILAHCLLITNILDKLPDLDYDDFEMWLKYVTDDGDNILKFLFKLIERLYFELISTVYLPGIMLKGKPPIFNSLYHHLCIHVCGFIASFPTEHFTIVENVLLEALISDCVWLNVLSIDVWCFLSRYSTSNLCLEHFKVLLNLHLELPYDSNVICLLSKLFSFLSITQQSQLLNEYPVDKYIKLWSVLSTNDDIKSKVQKYYAQVNVNLDYEASQFNNDMTIDKKLDLIKLFLSHIPAQVGSKFISNCLSDTKAFKTKFQEWFLCKITSCVYVMTKNVETQCIIHVFESLDNVLDLNMEKTCENSLNLLTLLLLKGLSSKHLPYKLQEKFTKYFTYSLTNKNYILKLFAFEALVIFARVTPHKMLLKNILKEDSKEFFTRFLQQIPYNQILSIDETKIIASRMFDSKSMTYVSNVSEEKNYNVDEIYDKPSKKPRLVESHSSSSMNVTISNLRDVQREVEKAWLQNCMSPSDSKNIRVIVEKILEYV